MERKNLNGQVESENNFCHNIGCIRANYRHLEDGWRCFDDVTNKQHSRCDYFFKDGTIDLACGQTEWSKNRVDTRNGRLFSDNYRTEIQIIAAMEKTKRISAHE
jgi:hypothetical protein